MELLWNNLRSWLIEQGKYLEVLTYMEQQEAAYKLATNTIGNFTGNPEDELQNTKTFLTSLLELTDATEQEKKEILKLMEEQ